MRFALVLGCVLASGIVHAQASPDALDKLRACSALTRSDRLDCLDRLASDIEPRPPSAPEAAPEPPSPTEWIVSETTSPLDYSPIAVAKAATIGTDRIGLQLSIRCRAGRSELVVSSNPVFVRRPEEYHFTYSVNRSAPTALSLSAATTGPGLAVKVDPARLLSSLPPTGSVTFRLAHANDPVVEGRYALDQLRTVTLRLAAPCKWPPIAVQGRP